MTMLGWYFAPNDKRLGNGDGRLIQCGTTHKVDCEPVLCQSGLHASKRIIDALQYAPGNVLCRVELGGRIMHGDDKSCATERTYLAIIDAEALLREFTRQCALDVAHLWNAPEVVLQYLRTGNEEIREAARVAAMVAAWAAARAAAWEAARAAACGAAWDAARAAACGAAWAAARAAACGAAWDAAMAAARAAAMAAQNRRLTQMAMDALAPLLEKSA